MIDDDRWRDLTAPQSRNPERTQSLSIKLAVVARRLRMRFDESIQRGTGVTRAYWSVIAAASRIPGATQKSIARALQISEVSAGRLIDRLCSEGLLDRVASSEDRRAYSISTTERARPLLKEMSAVAAAQEERAFRGLTDADLAELERMLDIIGRNIGVDDSSSCGTGQ
jgi:MarR family transcriptional regulator, transcriptional regulator for hemolysin